MKSYHSKPNPSRRKRWLVAAALLSPILLAIAIGLLYLEIARFELMQSQLRSITESAALSGTETLKNALGKHSVEESQMLAMKNAVWTFKKNSILDNHFTDSNVGADLNDGGVATPNNPGELALNITLVDRDGNVLPTGNENAVAVKIQAMYAEAPLLAFHFIPLAPVIRVSATAMGGMPMLDVVICFDLSGSMDDQTPVSLVNRHWDGKKIVYTAIAKGTISDIFGPGYTGTQFNCAWPQNLSLGALSGNKANAHPQVFSESPDPSPNPIEGLRANLKFTSKDNLIPEQGCPPGNFDASLISKTTINNNQPTACPTGFTDCVVDIGNQGDFSFPNIATCVEASRGNLENVDVFRKSKANTNSELARISPKRGYYEAYWTAARNQSEPMRTARQAITEFMNTLSSKANVHYGLVTFSNTAGSELYSVWAGANTNKDKIDDHYTAGGTGDFPMPFVGLSTQNDNLAKITSAINGTQNGHDLARLTLGATGATNFADPLKVAITELKDLTVHRWKADPIIVFFTDGVPDITDTGPLPDCGAFDQARLAKEAAIAIHTVALAQNQEIQPLETEILGDGKQSGAGTPKGSDGIAQRSGRGAIYLQVKKTADLKNAFQQLAKTLYTPSY